MPQGLTLEQLKAMGGSSQQQPPQSTQQPTQGIQKPQAPGIQQPPQGGQQPGQGLDISQLKAMQKSTGDPTLDAMAHPETGQAAAKAVLQQSNSWLDNFVNFGQKLNGMAEVSKGFVKGGVKTLQDINSIAENINPTVKIGRKIEPQWAKDVNAKVGKFVDEHSQYSNPKQKIGGALETVAEVLAPEEKILGLGGKAAKAYQEGKVLKPLELNAKELLKVNKNKLKYLSKDAMETTKMVGGVIKDKAYGMTEEVKNLATEFKDILKGSNPEKNLKRAQAAGKDYWQKTVKLFEDNKSLINEKTLRAKLEKALHSDTTTSYASKFEKKDVTKKAIDGFINKVKEGTNLGVEQARTVWRKEAAKTTGALSKANDVIHNAVKEVVKESLPKAEQEAYDLYKEKMAKLFDVREILRAKKAATAGKEALVKTGLKVGGAVAATAEGAKRLFTGHW